MGFGLSLPVPNVQAFPTMRPAIVWPPHAGKRDWSLLSRPHSFTDSGGWSQRRPMKLHERGPGTVVVYYCFHSCPPKYSFVSVCSLFRTLVRPGISRQRVLPLHHDTPASAMKESIDVFWKPGKERDPVALK